MKADNQLTGQSIFIDPENTFFRVVESPQSKNKSREASLLQTLFLERNRKENDEYVKEIEPIALTVTIHW